MTRWRPDPIRHPLNNLPEAGLVPEFVQAALDLTWFNMSEERHEEWYQERRDERTGLIESINSQFAIVRDGPGAGQIVNVANGQRTSRRRIDSLFYREAPAGSSGLWLFDERRREISATELQEIEARYAASKPRARRSKGGGS